MSDSPVLSPTPETATVTTGKPNRHHGDILFAFGVALALCIAWYVRRELVLIYVSALFAVVLMPVLRGIMKLHIGKWHPGRGAAIFILLLAIAAAIALFSLFALPPVVRDLHEFALEMPTRGPQLLSRIRTLPFSQHVNVNALNAKLQDFASNIATYVLHSIRDWARTLFEIITGVILTVYFMLEGETAYFWLLSFLPVGKRQRLDTTYGPRRGPHGQVVTGAGITDAHSRRIEHHRL